MGVPTNAKEVIILQYINVSNQHVAHPKLTQCYISILQNEHFAWRYFPYSRHEIFLISGKRLKSPLPI